MLSSRAARSRTTDGLQAGGLNPRGTQTRAGAHLDTAAEGPPPRRPRIAAIESKDEGGASGLPPRADALNAASPSRPAPAAAAGAGAAATRAGVPAPRSAAARARACGAHTARAFGYA